MKIPKSSEGAMVDAPECEECTLPIPSWALRKQFATHRSIEDESAGVGAFVCAEVTTGCSVGRGDSREEAMAAAMLKLTKHTEHQFDEQVKLVMKRNKALLKIPSQFI